jgi:hypothetical protein
MSSRVLERASLNIRLAAKRIDREALEIDKQARRYELRLRDAIAAGDAQSAELYASQMILQRNRALALRRTSIRMGIMNDNITAARRSNAFHRDMLRVANALQSLDNSMPADRVAAIFERLEQSQDNMQVNETLFAQMTDRNNATLVPPEQVSEAIKKVAAEHALELSEQFSKLAIVRSTPAAAAAPPLVAAAATRPPAEAVALLASCGASTSSLPDLDSDDLEARLLRLKAPPPK